MAIGRSLHIGLNRIDPQHYAGWSGPLQACEADARAMEALANAKGYQSETLLTPDATRQAVTEAIRRAADRLQAGDLFLGTYAGHGGQVPDFSEDDDDEGDLQDETWCLFDAELVDDELGRLWTRFAAGVRVLVLSDSCHSGSASRNAAAFRSLSRSMETRQHAAADEGRPRPVFRLMPEEVARNTATQNAEFYRALAGSGPASSADIRACVRLISGCQDNQLSMDGVANGLFTGTLLDVWDDGAFRGNYQQFHQQIVARMPPTQRPNHLVVGEPNVQFDRQSPFTV